MTAKSKGASRRECADWQPAPHQIPPRRPCPNSRPRGRASKSSATSATAAASASRRLPAIKWYGSIFQPCPNPATQQSAYHPIEGTLARNGQTWQYEIVFGAVPAQLKFFGVKAIYALTPCSEEDARASIARGPRTIENVVAVPKPTAQLEAGADPEGQRGDDPEPDHNDRVLCCPDCETPNQFGEQCPRCRRAPYARNSSPGYRCYRP